MRWWVRGWINALKIQDQSHLIFPQNGTQYFILHDGTVLSLFLLQLV